MGILTDPSLSQRNPIGQTLLKHKTKICIVLYFLGLIWFVCLGHTDFNHATYLSENALSPGLVYSEMKLESARLAQVFQEELNRVRETHKSGIPYAWLMAKFRQIGLETFTHNYTLNFPLGGGKTFQGKNVYGILRAPRIGSTEGIVFSTPYRAPDSVHTNLAGSVPILLAFADFARTRNYWAKDLIFLITDQEQLGMHAWLEAYYKGGLEYNAVLNAGNLEGRAGALQAALNLEIQDFDLEYIDVKLEGLNGQLPNLDLFNLVQRIAIRENLISGYKQKPGKKRSFGTLKENVMHMVKMILTQATGVPTGNHGLFHRYRIESLTLEGVKRDSINHQSRNAGALAVLRTVEGISRSLNNLLERFHQSFFFYILVANDRFVSIGDFMPCLVLMAGPLIIKAYLLWQSLNNERRTETEKDDLKTEGEMNMQYIPIGIILALVFASGLLVFYFPLQKYINELLFTYGFQTETIITSTLIILGLPSLILPFCFKLNHNGMVLLHIATLLCMGCALIVIGLLNFSLGFILSVFLAPLGILIEVKEKKFLKRFTSLYTVLLHPLLFSYLITFVFTLNSFRELTIKEVAIRAVTAMMDALTFSAADFLIYGHWMYFVATTILFPIWILLCCCQFIRKTDVIPKKLKTN